jgi:hypothetical protein
MSTPRDGLGIRRYPQRDLIWWEPGFCRLCLIGCGSTAVAWNYADAIRRSPASVRYTLGFTVGILGVLARGLVIPLMELLQGNRTGADVTGQLS